MGARLRPVASRPVRVWGLLSWYDERPDWLTQAVESVAPLVDGVIAVDGPYPLTAHDSNASPREQAAALTEACEKHGLEFHLHAPGALAEVDKRAYMFRVALSAADPMRDWFLILDGDMWMGAESWPERARWHLEHAEHHVAEITFHNLDPQIDGNPKVRAFRSLFRAIPGLTVDGNHATYTVPDFEGERLLMWQAIGDRQPVPALNLSSHIHLYHRPHLRDQPRQALRVNYYDRRATANIESVPTYE